MKHTLKNPANHFAMLLMALAMAFTFLACEEKDKVAEGGSVKLLEKGLGGAWGLEYDVQNRIVKYNENATITYNGDGSVIVERPYSYDMEKISLAKKGNTITENYIELFHDLSYYSYIITINEDGYIAKTERLGNDNGKEYSEVNTYQYQDGNLISKKTDKRNQPGKAFDIEEHKYDDKKSPFYNCNTPKWLLQYLFGHLFASRNNVIETVFKGKTSDDVYGTSTASKYEYDENGFPTKQTSIEKNNVAKYDNTTTTPFTYKSKLQRK
jgi:hypothetical protein